MSGGPSIGLQGGTRGGGIVYIFTPKLTGYSLTKSFILYTEEIEALKLLQIADQNRNIFLSKDFTEAQFRGLVWRLRKANGKCGEASSREINNQQEK
jgi:hypothetical protein